jgi:GNAT superfamily N-acetyltransferase
MSQQPPAVPHPIAIVLHTPPAADAQLVSLLQHKGSPWIEDIQRRLGGAVPGSRDCFAAAYAGSQPVAHAWYTAAAGNPRLGLLGHVFTRPEYRGRGLATRLIDAALRHFRAAGGEVMQLFTYAPESIPLYERCGFEQLCAASALHGQDWSMRYPVASRALVEDWFAPSACTLRELAPADLPQFCLLYNLEYDTALKDRAQRIACGVECELAFLQTVQRIACGQGACWVADNGRTIVGIASLMRCEFAPQSHLALADFYVHPRSQSQAGPLMAACLSQPAGLGAEIIYGLVVDEAKHQVFADRGFRRKAVLQGHYRLGEARVDCTLYEFDRRG